MSDGKPCQGEFCWNELMTRDPEKAGKFFADLIGWDPTDSGTPGPPKYTLFKKDGKDKGGMMQMPPDVPAQIPSHWIAYITVDHVDATAKRVPELGGVVMVQPQDIPNVGRFSVIQDPTGAIVGIITLAGK